MIRLRLAKGVKSEELLRDGFVSRQVNGETEYLS